MMHDIFLLLCYFSPHLPFFNRSGAAAGLCCSAWIVLLCPPIHSKSTLAPGASSSVMLTWTRGVEFVWQLGLFVVTSSRTGAVPWTRKQLLSRSVPAADVAGCREGLTCRWSGCKTSCSLDLAGRLVYGLDDCRLASNQEERPVGTSFFLLCLTDGLITVRFKTKRLSVHGKCLTWTLLFYDVIIFAKSRPDRNNDKVRKKSSAQYFLILMVNVF